MTQMFQPYNLQRLYPHLNFGRLENRGNLGSPSAPSSQKRSLSEPPKIIVEENIVATPIQKPTEVTEKRVRIETGEAKIQEYVPDTLVEKKKRQPKVIATPTVELQPEPVVIKVPAKKSKKEGVMGEPKVPPPVRASQIPVKGERGLQKKYTTEQRKTMYLNRLSKKSLKNAEKEVAEVNAVLESVDHDPVRLQEKEREIKKSLRLINYAKYFSGDSNITENECDTKTIVSTEPPTSEPQESSGSDLSDASE